VKDPDGGAGRKATNQDFLDRREGGKAQRRKAGHSRPTSGHRVTLAGCGKTHQKQRPQINADKHRLKTKNLGLSYPCLSAFIGG
jgi:hypothetical protein